MAGIHKNPLKEKLRAGGVVYGPFVRLATPQVMEILGYAGFDFCIIDTEHGCHNSETVENLVRAAERTDMTPIVRTSFNTSWMILHALDSGAKGVQIPGIGNAKEAEAAVRMAKYYPVGERGVCRFVRSAEYSHIPSAEYFISANEEILVVIMVEGAEGIDNLDLILDEPGVDVVFLGPYDLSQYLGLTGQVEHPEVISLLNSLVKRIRNKGLVAGIFTDNIERVSYWREAGVQYISVGIDTGILFNAAKNMLTLFRS